VFGDLIEIAPGTYDVETNLGSQADGADGAPIIVRAREPGTVRIRFVGPGNAETFLIRHPYWVVEGLDIEGACPTDINCEHAFHIVGRGRRAIIRGNRIWDFNQAFHISPSADGTSPDDGLIESNEIFLTRPRPVGVFTRITGIRLASVSRWIVRGNVFYDIVHEDRSGYGGYLTDGGEGGVFERNLVWCSRFLTGGGPRVGLSVSIREDTGNMHHTRATFRNNLVRGCDGDAILIKGCADCSVMHQTVIEGDVRIGETSTVSAIGNLIAGGLVVSADSTLDGAANLTDAAASLPEWLVDLEADARPRAGAALDASGADVADDFCGGPRSAPPTIGALERGSACAGTWAPGTRGAP
jgi:hypothetical protein